MTSLFLIRVISHASSNIVLLAMMHTVNAASFDDVLTNRTKCCFVKKNHYLCWHKALKYFIWTSIFNLSEWTKKLREMGINTYFVGILTQRILINMVQKGRCSPSYKIAARKYGLVARKGVKDKSSIMWPHGKQSRPITKVLRLKRDGVYCILFHISQKREISVHSLNDIITGYLVNRLTTKSVSYHLSMIKYKLRILFTVIWRY